MNDSAREGEKPSKVEQHRRKRAPAKRISITDKMVEKAVAAARAGRQTVILDEQCRGLELRGWKGGTVNWTLRTRLHGYLKRYVIGGASVPPKEARTRGWAIKQFCQDGQNPAGLITQFLTGKSIERQEREAAERGPPSIPWETAVDLFLAEKNRTRRRATYDDYRNVLKNTPELQDLMGRPVAKIASRDIGLILVAIHRRSEAYSEHVARVVSSLFGYLVNLDDPDPNVTPEQAAAIRLKKPPERTRFEHGEAGTHLDKAKVERIRQIEGMLAPPTIEQIGRVVAIAKGPALSTRARSCVLLTAATAQRRRTVAALWDLALTDHGDEVEWAIPPAHRKTANKTRSKSPHRIPLIGWAAQAARDLRPLTNGMWLFPAGPTDAKQTRYEHVDPGWVTKLHSWIPGGFNPHAWRKALATYGSEYLGWPEGSEKIILDHMEGHDSADVTPQHYNLDPRMAKKREMLTQWQRWLDEQAAAAIKREPWLTDAELIRERIYRKRYGEAAWQRAVDRAREKKSDLPWALAVA